MNRWGWMGWLGAAACGLWAASAWALWNGSKQMVRLEDVDPAPEEDCPILSVVIPLRDEARHVEETVGSILNAGYLNLQTVAVDDRSTDGTGAILDRMAEEDPRLTIVHLETLPEGWLGINYAMAEGAAAAQGEFLVLTDSGVRFRPGLLRRAVSLLNAQRLDHLALFPEEIFTSFSEGALLSYYGRILYHLGRRSWEASNPESAAHVGAGAFNLVRRSLFEQLDAGRVLRLEAVNDIALGRLVKQSGGRQCLAIGGTLLRKRWYVNLGALLRGFDKNSFAAMNYDWRRVLAVTALLVPCHVLPAVGLLFGSWRARAACAGAFALMALTAAMDWGDSPPPERLGPSRGGRLIPEQMAYGLAYPVAAACFLGILWRAALRAEITGGILWKGRRYSLRELREARGSKQPP